MEAADAPVVVRGRNRSRTKGHWVSGPSHHGASHSITRCNYLLVTILWLCVNLVNDMRPVSYNKYCTTTTIHRTYTLLIHTEVDNTPQFPLRRVYVTKCHWYLKGVYVCDGWLSSDEIAIKIKDLFCTSSTWRLMASNLSVNSPVTMHKSTRCQHAINAAKEGDKGFNVIEYYLIILLYYCDRRIFCVGFVRFIACLIRTYLLTST